jgi:hypothetical protein
MKANLQLQPSLRKSWRNQRWVEIVVAVAILVLVAVGVAYWQASRRTPAVLVALPDPAAPSVMRYIQAHEALNAPAAVAPALPATQNYIRAHEALNAAAVPPDAATQGILGYIRAHSTSSVAPIDPATQSVLDYLRMHAH